jgi:hypothetical protein
VGSLIPVDGGGPVTRCKLCGKPAVGPCARCRGSVCGDCCELTEGGASTFAVCLSCVGRGGATLAPAWRGLLAWLALVMLALVAVGVALMMLRRG